MSHERNEKHERASDAILQLRKLSVDPPPYLKARVLSELSLLKSHKRGVRLWQWLAGASSALGAIAVVWLTLARTPVFMAVTDRPFVVKIEMEELETFRVASAEIVLPDGIHFYSQSFPELGQKRSLSVAWSAEASKGQLPFVIQGEQAGNKVVLVKFYDRDHNQVGERKLEIKFVSSPSKKEG